MSSARSPVAFTLIAVLATATVAGPFAGATAAADSRAQGRSQPATPPRPAAPSRQVPPGTPGGSESVRVGPVVLNKQVVDFGIVGPNTQVEAEIEITNVTDEPLKIRASVPSCQCTTVDMTGVVIQPGATVPMPMSMKTSGSTGIKMAGVTLVFEGHSTPVQVSIRSEVAYSVRATPPFIDVQQSPRDPRGGSLPSMSLTGTVVLESVDGKPFRVLGFHGKAPRLVDFDPAVDEPRSRYEVMYDLTEENRAGQVSHYKIVETDRDDCPAIDLRVRHETTHLRPNFSIAEFRSAVGLLKPGEAGRFDLEIRNLGSRRVVEVVSKDPARALTRLVDQRPDGQNLLISVEVLPAPSVRGMLYFMTTIRTADGAETDLIVFGRVAE